MTLPSKAETLFRKNFGGDPAVITCAPGRIEFIGNHTDYNAGTVLGASIDRSICVAARLRDDDIIALVSDHSPAIVKASARSPQKLTGDAAWANYSLGVLVALEARGLPRHGPGFELAVVSDLPVGAGLSSSAALELATALALSVLRKCDLPREELVQACREAENKFVGVPCGILDQGVSGFGRRDHLVHIDCRGPHFSTIPLPPRVQFWIFNTHTKHALVDSLYATRHRECMEAAQVLGVAWLADLAPAQVIAARNRLPETTWKRARHIVEEIARVAGMREALGRRDLVEAGRLLNVSHESSRTLFENSTPELDFLVDSLRGRAGVHGARLTGGGFGGAVMAMTDASFNASAAVTVAAAYAEKFGSQPDILNCATADGARVVRQ
jgi:galactokinase